MEQDDGFCLWVRGKAEEEDVAIRAEAADDLGTRRGVDGVALVADGDFAIVTDTDAGLLAPDKGPPRALGGGANERTLVCERLLLGGVWRLGYLHERKRPVAFTRSRPYHKDDNAHVEQKNWMWPRQLLGYGRLESAAAVVPLCTLYQEAWGPLMNFFLPGLTRVPVSSTASM